MALHYRSEQTWRAVPIVQIEFATRADGRYRPARERGVVARWDRSRLASWPSAQSQPALVTVGLVAAGLVAVGVDATGLVAAGVIAVGLKAAGLVVVSVLAPQ